MKNLKKLLKDPYYKKQVPYFLLTYFFILFNYPLVRASATTLFFEEFEAKSSPLAWLVTIIILSITIFIFNKIQAQKSVQKVFLFASFFSASLFLISTTGFHYQFPFFSAIGFVWKEICIVLQVHLVLAYANNFFKKEDFKSVIGPLGAIGSIGGILGGLTTSYLGQKFGPIHVSYVSLLFVLAPSFFFLLTPELSFEGQKTKQSPLQSLNTSFSKKYVFYISLMVMLSQFIINIADFKFNLTFEQNISSLQERTSYLGNVYSSINGLSLFFQIFALPFLLPRISVRNLHFFVPCSYFLLLATSFLNMGYQLFFISGFYIYLKASDYSLFSAGKEILYQRLSPEQKYGAKYLSDMLVYRFSKALIAVVLIYVQTSFMLNVLMIIFLFLWVLTIFQIFKIK